MTLPEGRLAELADDLKAGITVLTRLPFARATPIAGADLARATWTFPIAGIGIGVIGAVVYAIAHKLGMPGLVAAPLAVAATLATSGCLHEDGLADTADGFGGGATRERKLDIMRDSRIGNYGVCALAMSLLLRTGALAALADPALVVPALIAAHGAARATIPAFMFLVPPARSDGLSFQIGAPPPSRVLIAAVIGMAILAICLGPGLALVALLLLIAVMAAMAWLSLAEISGQTGDVLGALEQVSEIVILLVALR
jgi:adenosylcobinamide-GDP ribazoletransferase